MSLQLAGHDITAQHRETVQQCVDALGEWRAFIIAIDGWTGSGKSTLARFLAWQLEMPCVETDLFLTGDAWGSYDFNSLRQVLNKRLEHRSRSGSLGRPVIVEGVGLLHILKTLSLEPNFLIQVHNESRVVCDSEEYLQWMRDYEAQYQPVTRTQFVFRWAQT